MRLRRLLASILAALGLTGAAPALAAPPDLGRAASAILIDADDGQVMLARHPDERRSMASTAKLMTALLALERARPQEVLTAPEYDALPAESRIDLRAGERIRVGTCSRRFSSRARTTRRRPSLRAWPGRAGRSCGP